MKGTNTITAIMASGDPIVDGLLSSTAWSGTITYAFPTSATDYVYTYESSQNFGAFNSAMQSTALFGLNSVKGFTLANIVAGGDTTSAIRFAQSDAPTTAYAYTPGNYSQAGDLWFGRTQDYTAPVAGNYAHHSILHELGHALGLKHGHEVGGGFPALPLAYDSLEYSIMTYRAYIGDPSTGSYAYNTGSAPQSFMMADIAALQNIYGADYTYNSGNTVYSWNPNSGDTAINGSTWIDALGNKVFATIWDGGGVDTYDLSAYSTGVTISLKEGDFSTFSSGQKAVLEGSGHLAQGNIYNSLLFGGNTASLIENATGGSGADVIEGNGAANALLGGSGNDVLKGANGNDVLRGNTGTDQLRGGKGTDTMYGGGDADRFIFTLGTDTGIQDIVDDFSNGSDKLCFEGAVNVSALINSATYSSGHTTITWADGSIQLKNFNISDLNAADFLLI